MRRGLSKKLGMLLDVDPLCEYINGLMWRTDEDFYTKIATM